MASILFACQEKQEKSEAIQKTDVQNEKFEYLSEEFADIKILRYQVPGFDQLSLSQKNMCTTLVRQAWREEISCMIKIIVII